MIEGLGKNKKTSLSWFLSSYGVRTRTYVRQLANLSLLAFKRHQTSSTKAPMEILKPNIDEISVAPKESETGIKEIAKQLKKIYKVNNQMCFEYLEIRVWRKPNFNL
jgi:hypothetical protein